MSFIFHGPPEETQPRRYAPVAAVSAPSPKGFAPAERFAAIWTDDDYPTVAARKFAPLSTTAPPFVGGFNPGRRFSAVWTEDEPITLASRRFAPLAVASYGPATRIGASLQPDDEQTPQGRRYAPVAVSLTPVRSFSGQARTVCQDDEAPGVFQRRFAPLATVLTPVRGFAASGRTIYPDDDPPALMVRRFSPLAPIRSANPAKRAYAAWSEDEAPPPQTARRFTRYVFVPPPPYVATGPRAKIFGSLLAAGAWDEPWPEQHRVHWQTSVPQPASPDAGKSAAFVVNFDGKSGTGGGVFTGAESDLALGFTGLAAGGVLSIGGKTDWTPILEIQLAVDAAGRVLLIDATGRVLDVSAGNNGWIGQSAAKNI